MIVLHGTLRQSAQVTIKEKPLTKLWVEHSSPRDNGTEDLAILELFLPYDKEVALPRKGEDVEVIVRPYPSGRGVAFQAIAINSNGLK